MLVRGESRQIVCWLTTSKVGVMVMEMGEEITPGMRILVENRAVRLPFKYM
jgi:hypothetical protein